MTFMNAWVKVIKWSPLTATEMMTTTTHEFNSFTKKRMTENGIRWLKTNFIAKEREACPMRQNVHQIRASQKPNPNHSTDAWYWKCHNLHGAFCLID